jgi:streptogramin lyase
VCAGVAPVQAASSRCRGFQLSNGSAPFGITAGPDRNAWFTESSPSDGKIGRITPDGVVTEFELPDPVNALPKNIVAGPDGNLWFTESIAKKIGRITPAGFITEFMVPPSGFNGYPGDIAPGPDGNLWSTEGNDAEGGAIGRITTAGEITEFSIGQSGSAYGIAGGPDGNVWFTEDFNNKIGPCGFTEVGTERIGRITTTGVIRESAPQPGPYSIALGPDGNLRSTSINGHSIGACRVR